MYIDANSLWNVMITFGWLLIDLTKMWDLFQLKSTIKESEHGLLVHQWTALDSTCYLLI